MNVAFEETRSHLLLLVILSSMVAGFGAVENSRKVKLQNPRFVHAHCGLNTVGKTSEKSTFHRKNDGGCKFYHNTIQTLHGS